MSEQEQDPQYEQPEEQVQDDPPKKSGKGVMTEQKRLNLEKARAARKANLEAKKKRYPVAKRAALDKKIEEEDLMEKRIVEEAERKVQEILKQQQDEPRVKWGNIPEKKHKSEEEHKQREAYIAKEKAEEATFNFFYRKYGQVRRGCESPATAQYSGKKGEKVVIEFD
ncbi:hypothetical protein HK097_000417 [Rhizophlyctis rosea]|uniref:Uncharacterized protein n=1 Tax=Rhizophlyctis rosea TaxID=64517 RepID=A0AAD5X8D5_9FUNG|nr:hypothetical protein HK097_000417 [Rhizophlyctis rosea]